MKKPGIAFIFFTLCVIYSSASFGQASRTFSVQGSTNNKNTIIINGDTLGDPGTVTINGNTDGEMNLIPDSIQGELKDFSLPDFSSKPSTNYLSKDGKRYYMDIVPPAIKGNGIDHSDVWLLGGK
jgi:hypothetical protein